MRTTTIKKTLSLALILVTALLTITGCGGGGTTANMPYEPDTPAPPNHDGVFVSDHGTMTFNGDGKTVKVDIDDELAQLMGLSTGSFEGTYVFLSGYLPPVGSVDVRYDVAHELEIRNGDERVVVNVGLASEDGKTASVGTGIVTEQCIPLLFDIDDKNVTIPFNKQ